ncbi:MAG: copper-binding protein [Planctomycetota bacterium]|nr:copper-binding protein [Planctomycetota bacterium]
MRKITLAALIFSLLPAYSIFAADGMGGMPGMGGGSAAAPAADPNKIYTTAGVVVAVDPEEEKLEIAHEPIPALGLPAMNMRFSLDLPDMLNEAKKGDKVRIDFRVRDNVYTLIDISVSK